MDDRRRSELMEHRRLYVAEAGNQSDQFDKTLILLSGGALGLSALLIDRPGWNPDFLLVASWAFYTTTLASVLISFKVSEEQFHRDRDAIDESLRTGEEGAYVQSKWGGWLHFLNWAAGGCFLIGTVLFLLFAACAAITEQGEASMSEKDRGSSVGLAQDGKLAAPPPPSQNVSAMPQKSGGDNDDKASRGK